MPPVEYFNEQHRTPSSSFPRVASAHTKCNKQPDNVVRFGSEWLSALRRNPCPVSLGITVRFASEYAPDGKLGPTPEQALSKDEHAKNNLPDVLTRWQERDGKERKRPRTAQSFCVPMADIEAQGFDLSINRYKEVVHEEVNHRKPKEILADLAKLEAEIQKGMKELEGMLK